MMSKTKKSFIVLFLFLTSYISLLLVSQNVSAEEKQKVKSEKFKVVQSQVEAEVEIKSKGITKFGSSVKVKKDEVVEGDIIVFGGSIKVDGKVKGEVVVVGGSIKINGIVEGDVIAIGGNIKIKKTAIIEGGIITIGGVSIVEEGAKIKGEQTTISELKLEFDKLPKFFHYPTLFWFKLGMVIVYIILLLLIPKPVDVIANTVINYPGKSFLFGILAGILFFPICIFLVVTIIGIILIPLVIIGYIATLLVGWLAVAQQIGSKLLAIIKKEEVTQFTKAISGVLFLEVVLLIPLINIIIWCIIVSFGFGACILSRFGTKTLDN